MIFKVSKIEFIHKSDQLMFTAFGLLLTEPLVCRVWDIWFLQSIRELYIEEDVCYFYPPIKWMDVHPRSCDTTVFHFRGHYSNSLVALVYTSRNIHWLYQHLFKHGSENIIKKRLFPKFQLILIFAFQLCMIMCTGIAPETAMLN